MKHPLPLLLFSFIFVCVSILGAESSVPLRGKRPPNIVLILADDMGYSDIGCYGGVIATPNLDRLADNGVRFTQFYNTARCCPSRASLLTGLHPHQAGVGYMMVDHKLPGYRGELAPSCMTIAEVLRTSGYKNYCVGKWHLTQSFAADQSHENWPLQRGFDRFYGTLAGAGNYFDPSTLVRDEKPISPFSDTEYTPEGEFYYTDAITDNAIRFLQDHGRDTKDAPFFLYVAYTCAHWPMQIPNEDIGKYKGRFNDGYDAVRKIKFEKLKALGFMSPNETLPEPDENWSKVERKEWEAACMEVYAAMVERMDRGIGRIVGELEGSNRMNETVVFFLQDNGACEGNNGWEPNKKYPNRVERPVFKPIPLEEPRQDESDRVRTREGFPVVSGQDVFPGPKDTFIAYGRGWANVSNTPFREYKGFTHEGGIATPLIVHAPQYTAESAKGILYREYGQLPDIMASCLELAGAKVPETRETVPVTRPVGTSLLPALQGQSLNRFGPLFWEHKGHRAIRDGDWKLVTRGARASWELYNIHADRNERTNLAKKHPERVAAMAAQWTQWAKAANVLPWPWEEPKP